MALVAPYFSQQEVELLFWDSTIKETLSKFMRDGNQCISL